MLITIHQTVQAYNRFDLDRPVLAFSVFDLVRCVHRREGNGEKKAELPFGLRMCQRPWTFWLSFWSWKTFLRRSVRRMRRNFNNDERRLNGGNRLEKTHHAKLLSQVKSSSLSSYQTNTKQRSRRCMAMHPLVLTQHANMLTHLITDSDGNWLVDLWRFFFVSWHRYSCIYLLEVNIAGNVNGGTAGCCLL